MIMRPIRQHRVLPISGLWHTRCPLAGHKLAAVEVQAIRQWSAARPTLPRYQQARMLAPRFHVTRGTIISVLTRETWAWLAQES